MVCPRVRCGTPDLPHSSPLAEGSPHYHHLGRGEPCLHLQAKCGLELPVLCSTTPVLPFSSVPPTRHGSVCIIPSTLCLPDPAVCRGAPGRGPPPLHPPQLSAQRGGQRGTDQVVRSVSGPGQRSQTLPHAAPRPPGDADTPNPAPPLSRY